MKASAISVDTEIMSEALCFVGISLRWA